MQECVAKDEVVDPLISLLLDEKFTVVSLLFRFNHVMLRLDLNPVLVKVAAH